MKPGSAMILINIHANAHIHTYPNRTIQGYHFNKKTFSRLDHISSVMHVKMVPQQEMLFGQ